MTARARKTRIVDRQLATFEALRRLGFTPEELFTSWNNGNPVTVVKAQGKVFVIDYKPLTDTEVPATEAAYTEAWTTAATAWNETLTDEERNIVYRKFIDVKTLLGLTVLLQRNGFTLSGLEKAMNRHLS